jgi:PAS domain S-box-containing protein
LTAFAGSGMNGGDRRTGDYGESLPLALDVGWIGVLRRAPGLSGGASVLVGVCVLLGWTFDLTFLTSVVPGWRVIAPNTALGFVLLGSGLMLLRGPRVGAGGVAADIVAIIPAAIGALTLAEQLFAVDLGIGRLLPFADAPQMAPTTAAASFLLGVSLLCVDRVVGSQGQILAFAAGLIALLGGLGFLLAEEAALRTDDLNSTMAVHTAATLLMASLGALFLRPNQGPVAIVVREGAAGTLSRRLLPASALAILAVGAVWATGHHLGVIVVLVWWSAVSLGAVEDQFRDLFEISLDAISIRSLRTGKILSVNPQFEKIMGYSRHEIVGQTNIEGSWMIDRVSAEDLIREIADGKIVSNREIPFRKKGGEACMGLVSGTLGRFEGQPAIILHTRDITERREAQRLVRESEERFRSLASSAPIGIFRSDAAGRCIYTNPRWQQMTGLTFEQGLGDGWSGAVHPEDRERVVAEWHRFAREGGELDTEFRFQRPGGEALWVWATAAAVRSASGEVLGYVGTNQDISARKAIEQLRHDLVRMLSHDIKNPLATVLGFAKILREDLHGRPDAAEAIDAIESGAERALSLAMNFLDADRIESGALEIRKSPSSLNEIVENVVGQQAPGARLRGVEVRTDLDAALPLIQIDAALLARVVANLLSNAIHFSRPRESIRVETRLRDRRAELSVRDRGPGIPVGERQEIFRRFVRGSKSRSDSTGLGLFVVKTIVDAHGGSVAVECPPEGGSVFVASLPLTPNI